jgi:hypothetical protein
MADEEQAWTMCSCSEARSDVRQPSPLHSLVLGSWMKQDSAKYSLVFAIYVCPDYGDDDILRNVLPMTDPHMLSW